MSFCEVLKLYNSGSWSVCLQFFNEYSSDISRKNIELPIQLNGFDEMAKTYLYENNSIMCKAIQEQSITNSNWSDYMDRFMKLYSRYRSLKSIHLDLELNVVYNLLWWFSIKPEMFKHKSLYFRNLLDIVSKITIKVLKTCGEVALGQEQCCYDVTRLMNQLRRASDVLLRLPPVSCMQLLSVITITVLVLLRHRNAESKAECISLMRNCVDQVDLLRLHMQHKMVSRNEEIYFKFGFTSVNSTASLRTSVECLDAFVITGSLVCAVNEQYKLAMDYLNQVSDEETNPFKFLINYIRAHCHFHLQQYSEAKLCLVYSTYSPAAAQYEGHYRLLLARLLSEQSDHQTALVHCEAVLASHPGLSSLAYHLATTVSPKLLMSTAQLIYLNKLVQSLKPSSVKVHTQFEGFEECCLTILCEQYSVSLHEALYSLARQLYLTGYHVKALDIYCELMELLKSASLDQGMKKRLPRKAQMLHETVLAHVKANNVKGGEQLCRQLIREYVPCRAKGIEGESSWEAALYGLEDDVVTMTLLADIVAHADKKKALDELNRCYNALSESREQGVLSPGESSLKELCEWLMSRILLRKAKLSSTDDAAHYFRRALMHKPGDKEVVFYYKQWALWHPDHQSFDPGDHITVFPVDQLYSLALGHLLGCSVTDEEWTALCDQESSQNVLESLFDDDD